MYQNPLSFPIVYVPFYAIGVQVQVQLHNAREESREYVILLGTVVLQYEAHMSCRYQYKYDIALYVSEKRFVHVRCAF